MKIGIMGAGAIGCYVGGRLLADGNDVVLVVRPALADELAKHGMHLTDLWGERRGASIDVDAARAGAACATSPERLADRDVVIVTVKGGDTAATAQAMAPHLKAGAVVVSFQNGVNNPAVLKASLAASSVQASSSTRVLAAMVPFNVLRKGDGKFHQGTSGVLAIEPGAVDLVDALTKAGMPAKERPDIVAVQWGKLVVNLNNAVNALAGIPIRDMILDAGYRAVMAAMIEEAIDVLEAAGIKPVLDPPLPPRFVPRLLRLPTFIFRFAARPMVKVDPQARSSMWDDLARGRTTEIDNLNGEIVALAHKIGRDAPRNKKLVDLVKSAEAAKNGSPRLPSSALR